MVVGFVLIEDVLGVGKMIFVKLFVVFINFEF